MQGLVDFASQVGEAFAIRLDTDRGSNLVSFDEHGQGRLI